MSLTKEREDYLLRRVQTILDKFPDERKRRTAFGRSCGTVQERIELTTKHTFDVDSLIILNRR